MTMKPDEFKVAAALRRELRHVKPLGGCPGLEEVAALADGLTAGARREELLLHLSSCADCRTLFLDAAALSRPESAGGRRDRFLFPSALAAAALLVLALSMSLKERLSPPVQLARLSPVAPALAPAPRPPGPSRPGRGRPPPRRPARGKSRPGRARPGARPAR